MTAQSFLPFDLVNTAGLIAWFYLCLYSVKRTHESPLVAKTARTAACVVAIFIGPLLLVLLFIIDTVQKLDSGSLSVRQVFLYTLDSLLGRERPLAEIASAQTPVPFKVSSFSGLDLEAIKKPRPQPQAVENTAAKPACIDLVKELQSSDSQQPLIIEPAGPAQTVHTDPSDVHTEPAEKTIDVQVLLREAIAHQASELTIESIDSGVRVYMKQDRRQRLFAELERRQGLELMRDFHLLAEIVPGMQTGTHTGSFFVQVAERTYCLRVISTPTLSGCKLVIRIVDPVVKPLTVRALGVPEKQIPLLTDALAARSGLILIAASRKANTDDLLYGLLAHPAMENRSRFYLQDFADKRLDGVTQVEINSSLGMTRAQSIHSAEQLSADVIALDWIENADTAKAVLQAAQNGVLVIGRIHADTAERALVRLNQWDLKLPQILPDIRLILTARRIRLLCEYCKRKGRLTDFQRQYLADRRISPRKVYSPTGCKHCSQTGYRGQGWLLDMLTVDPPLTRRCLDPGMSCETLLAEGEDRLTHHLRRLGMRKVLAGRTSLEEIKRVTESQE